jgi:hypothetical protein
VVKDRRKREVVMAKAQYRDNDDVPDMQWVARRQLAGSLVAAALIAIVSVLTLLGPTHRDTAALAPHRDTAAPASHRVAAIQHPSFVAPRVAVAVQQPAELP